MLKTFKRIFLYSLLPRQLILPTMSTADSRERMNELNKKAYNAEMGNIFEDPNSIGMGRFVMRQFLQFQPGKQLVDKPVECDLRALGSDSNFKIENVNTQIWKPDAKLLDFACGPGVLTETVLNYVGTAVGVDISPDMASIYNSKFPESKAKAYEMDLLKDDQTENIKATGKDFDLAVCSMSFHHIPDTQLATHRLVNLLKKDGWLFVLDMDGDMGSGPECHNHGHSHSHGHSHGQDNSHGHSHGHSHNKQDHLTKLQDETLEEFGVAHRHMSYKDLEAKFKNAGLKNASAVRNLKMVLWIDENSAMMRMFGGETNPDVPTRIENGVKQFQKVMHVAFVAGQK